MEINNVFKDKDGEKGIGVMDFINGLIEILRLETEELRNAAQQAFAPNICHVPHVLRVLYIFYVLSVL